MYPCFLTTDIQRELDTAQWQMKPKKFHFTGLKFPRNSFQILFVKRVISKGFTDVSFTMRRSYITSSIDAESPLECCVDKYQLNNTTSLWMFDVATDPVWFVDSTDLGHVDRLIVTPVTQQHVWLVSLMLHDIENDLLNVERSRSTWE